MAILGATALKSDSSKKPSQTIGFIEDPNTEAVVRQVFEQLRLPSNDVMKGGVKQGIAYLKEHRSPSFLVVDMSSSEMPLSDINALAEVCEPGVKVIALGERNDIGLFRDLIGLGVSDYLVKPLNQDLLQRSLTAAIEGQNSTRSKPRAGKVVTFYGARGGVGTTTLLCNLGYILLFDWLFFEVIYTSFNASLW